VTQDRSAWWTMHHFGVDCAILQGGVEGWEAEGRPLVTDEPDVPAGSFRVRGDWQRGHATSAQVLDALGSETACVVDALPSSSFTGDEPGYGPRKGHITGARSLPFRDLIVDETARFADPDTIEGHLRRAGLLDATHVVTYCGGAIAATVDAFALALFDHPSVAVYDGSLMEWSAEPALPMTDPSG
jgi:thiosulfate/3-mercaptopyruvate sulfurtransferase